MAKDAYYFPHDSNARHDPKVLAMRADFGLEGYALYWIIIEMMRDAEGYTLPLEKFIFKSISMESHSPKFTGEAVEQFIWKCIEEYKLFHTDNENFWSVAFLDRMAKVDEIRKKKSEAGRKGAIAKQANLKAQSKQNPSSAKAEPKQSQSNASTDSSNKRKGNETKLNHIKSSSSLLENEEETKKPTNPFHDDAFAKIAKYYEQGLNRPLLPATGDKLGELLDDFKNADLIIEAFKEAAEYQANNPLPYARRTLNDWGKKSITTVELLRAHKERESARAAPSNSNISNSYLQPSQETLERSRREAEEFERKVAAGEIDVAQLELIANEIF